MSKKPPTLWLFLYASIAVSQPIHPEKIFKVQPAERTRRLVSVDSLNNELLFCFSSPTSTELVKTDQAGNETARCVADGGSREALFAQQGSSILLRRTGVGLTELSPDCRATRQAKFGQKYIQMLLDGTDVIGVAGGTLLALDIRTLQPKPSLPFHILGDDPAYFVRHAPGSIAVAYIGTGRVEFISRSDQSERVYQCLDSAVIKRSEELDAHESLFAPVIGSWKERVLLFLSGFKAKEGVPLYSLDSNGNCARLALLRIPEIPDLVAPPTQGRRFSNPRGELSFDTVLATGSALVLIDRGSGFAAQYGVGQLRFPE